MINSMRKPRTTNKQFGHIYIRGIQCVGNTQPNQLESLKHYQENVKSFLCSAKIQQRFGAYIVTKMLKDEDAVAYLMYDFMTADWYHNKDKKASKITLRYQMGIWGIQKYLMYISKHKTKPIFSLDYDTTGDNNDLHNIIPDQQTLKYKDVLDKLIHEEQHQKLIELCNLKCLSRREKLIMKRYFFHRDTLQIIGNRRHISRERIRQIIGQCIQKIRKHVAKIERLRNYWEDEKETRTLKGEKCEKRSLR